jgi:hypothetical protein
LAARSIFGAWPAASRHIPDRGADVERIAHGAFGRVALLDMDYSLVRHAHPHCHVLAQGRGRRYASFTSVEQLQEHIDVFIAAYNETVSPFAWTKKKSTSGDLKTAVSPTCDSGY